MVSSWPSLTGTWDRTDWDGPRADTDSCTGLYDGQTGGRGQYMAPHDGDSTVHDRDSTVDTGQYST